MNGIEVFEIVITCLSPIIVAIIGCMQARRDKADKKYRELREQYDREKEDREAKEKEESDMALEEIKNSIKTMSDEIAELKIASKHQEINDELKALVKATTYNFEYSQSLSNVIDAIGTALQQSDNIPHDEINKAIEKHRETDQDLKTKLYKALY